MDLRIEKSLYNAETRMLLREHAAWKRAVAADETVLGLTDWIEARRCQVAA